MLYWDELYHINLEELRHEYVKLASELEVEQKENDELIKKVTELKDKITHYENMEFEYADHKEDYVNKYEELHELLIHRDNEINALKHMLDRKDEEKMRFVITNGLPILLENTDFIVRLYLPTPKRAKLPAGWVIKGGRVEHE